MWHVEGSQIYTMECRGVVWEYRCEKNSESNCKWQYHRFYPIGRAEIQPVCTKKDIPVAEKTKIVLY